MSSGNEKMPDIPSLTSEVNRLQSSSDWWINATLWLTAITALVAALYFVASRVAISRSTQLRQAQNSLGDAKDDQLARDLRGKDKEIANANARANEAAVKLEELRRQTAPRQLNRDAFFKAIDGKPKALTRIMYVRDDPECFDVAQQIYRVLKDAQWDAVSPVPIPSSNPNLRPDIPIAMSVGGQPSGVSVVAHSLSDEELEASKNISFGRAWKVTPYTSLSNALLESLGRIGGGAGGSVAPPDGELRIVVAPR